MKILEKIKAFSTGEGGSRRLTDEVSTEGREGIKSRRGFTIVELVIALSVIVIVTGISIGVVSVTNKSDGETIDMIEATNIGENAVECFRYAKNKPVIHSSEAAIRAFQIDEFEKAFLKSLMSDEEYAAYNIVDISTLTPEAEKPTGIIYKETIYSEEIATSVIYTVTVRDVKVTITLSNSEGDIICDTVTVSAASSTDPELITPISYTVR